ncbi:MAG: valine--tRNA ligase [Flavobacteriaceae bacterium]
MLEKAYDPQRVETRIYAGWEEAGAFRAGANARPGADRFCIVIPPPNVTGSLHMGHALNNTLQDVLVRWKRMQGFDVLWQPGTDHAGIATQMVVERQLMERQEPDRRKLGREEFIRRVWAWKEESGGTIVNQLKRLGASCDWSRERFTMDEGLSAAVLKVFVDLYRQGLIYRGKRLVNWDPHFETAISDLEVENIEVDGHMWHFKYPLAGGKTYTYVEKDEDGNVVLEEERDYISIATTRPETMLGDGAVAVHPSDTRYAPIVGELCEIPVGPKEHRRLIPIIVDEYPDPAFGSGAVKITGAHDFNDYQVARRNGIPLYRLMDTRGALRADGAPYAEEAAKARAIRESGATPDENEVDAINLVPDEYRGLDRFEARKRIVEAINADGLAVTETDAEGNDVPFVENKKIMQPFGDRSRVVIEPMLTDQWFADAKTLAEPAIAAVREGRTEFVPKSWENTYFNWMENIEPWCISRQLWWGHRIPAWYGPDGEHFVAHDEAEAKAMARERYGRDEPLDRDPDVLDTWFSSALWPFSTLGWPDETAELKRYYQTDVLVTGFDIIFFWVARMMMMGLHFMKDGEGSPVEPFHTVYIHALVRDEKGQKMSKSKGNVIDPLELIDRYGADALRFTLAAMAAQGRDIKLATSRVEGYRNFATKLWNAARFCEMNECRPVEGFDPAALSEPLNRWIVGAAGEAVAEVDAALESYRFNDAANAAFRFVWNTYCDWFLELSKPVLMGEDGAAKDETRATAAHVLDLILKILHPFMPFVTEELWQQIAARPRSLMLTKWPAASAAVDPAARDDIDWLVNLISQVRSVRAEMNVPAGAQIPLFFVAADEATRERAARFEEPLLRLARLSGASHAGAAPARSVQIVTGDQVVALPLEGIVDLDEEKARLKREIGKSGDEIARIEAKLGNDNFVSRAPAHVVDEQRERLAASRETLSRLESILARIA